MDSSESAPFVIARLAPSGRQVDAWRDRSLLASLEAGGIAWPSSCRNGTCRACLGRLASGRIRYRIEWPGLSAEEKADGWLLPCVAEACSDLVLDVPLAFALFED